MASLVLFICLLLFLHNISQSAEATGSLVNLGYAKYKGVQNPGGITHWLGMRYAAPPLGNLRFAAPEEPVKERKQQHANKVYTSLTFHFHFQLERHEPTSNN